MKIIDTQVTEGSVKTLDLRVATWLYLSGIPLTEIAPVEASRCSFTFTLSGDKIAKLMDQFTNSYPTADVREVINAYLYLVHRGKDMIKARRGGYV